MKDEMQEINSAPGIVQGQIRNPAEATPCENSDASPEPAAEQEQYDDEGDEYDDIDDFDDLYERWMDAMAERM